MNTINKEREDLEALLPWHAAGTLNPRDTERVEKALASDRELARQLEMVREELHETIHLNESLGAPSARAMEKLFAAIDAEPARRAKLPFDFAGWLAAFIARFSPRTLAWASAGAALLILLEAGVISSDLVKRQNGQVSAVAGNALIDQTNLASAEVRDGTLAVIRFVPKAEAADITNFLVANKASVIDGPMTGGMYTIRLPELGQAKEEHIKQIQAQSSIVDIIAAKQ